MSVATIDSLRQRNVGEIAVNLPGATGVFRHFGIDFCCHGTAPLDQAAKAAGIDVEILEEALEALDTTRSPEPAQDVGAIIDHIVSRFHEVHRRQLPELIALSRKVEQVHAGKAGVPAGLADLMQHALGELEVHMRKEELILFPAMRREGASPLDGPITQMRDEHVEHGEFIERVTQLTNDFTPPEGACGTWRALYAGAAQFKDDLIEHIHTENNILFPRFEAAAAG